jgi:rhamnosyltransferase
MTQATVSCIILTRNAGPFAIEMVEALSRQTLQPRELLVFDTNSMDGTDSIFAAAGARVFHVPSDRFHHASTRNAAARLALGEVLVFLTQDAIPAETDALERLVAPLAEGAADASFARHLPRASANPLERFARLSNYPVSSRTVFPEDLARMGIRACFFSNSCSAIPKRTLIGVGGFPAETVMNEDMLFAARALRLGYRLAYVAESRVWHSHDLTPLDTLKRYFDVGTVFHDASQSLADTKTGREGLAYARALLGELARRREFSWIALAVIETALKAAGFWLGRNYDMLPWAWRQRLSLHPDYWRAREATGPATHS